LLVGGLNTLVCYYTTKAMGVANWKAYFIPITVLSLAYVGYETRRILLDADRYLYEKFLLAPTMD
jgi:hypothetical protein